MLFLGLMVLSSSYDLQFSAEENLVPIRMQLKWFNGAKGFGFVVPEEGGFDAFLHVTTLQQAGVNSIGEGAVLLCTICDGQKGKQVKDVIEIIDPGSVNMMPQAACAEGMSAMGGIVKWYKPEKGFGFIIPDDGMKDVFVHKTCLDALGIDELQSGQRVRVTLKDVDKGREAVKIELAE